VCHIIFKLDYGGLENGLVNLINHLPSDRYRHTIVCLKGSTDFRKRLKNPDVPILTVNKRDGKDIVAYGRLWHLVRRLRPDIVHTRNLPALDMLAPARFAGVRSLVHSEHGVGPEFGRNWRYNQLRRLSRLIVSRYVFVSRDLANWWVTKVGIPTDKMSVIHNGVDVSLFHPAERRHDLLPHGFATPPVFVIGAVGRLEEVKDQVTLTRAFLRLLELRPKLRSQLRLVIVGDGSLRTEIESMLESAGAGALAWLPGFRDDAVDLYRAFSVFVLPSRSEGISNTLLEAMASGLPVVATRVGGNSEIVEEGRSGQLVPPRDPDAMAAALLSYIDNSGLIAAHGHVGRECIMRDFNLSTMVRAYGQLYAKLGEATASADHDQPVSNQR
jgi:sugar transferase (PEP-CTERM/EpsH1 system associated)